jgi:hypothetical protein
LPGIISWSDSFFLAAALVYLIGSMLRRGNLQIPTFTLAAAALVALSSLGSFATNAEASSLMNSLKFLATFFMMPVAIMWGTAGRIKAIDRLLWFWLVGGCISALIGVLGVWGIYILGAKKDIVIAGRASGLTFHPNVFGYVCAILVPIGIYLLITARNKVAQIFCIFATILLIYAIHLSGSRASILAVMASALVWLPNPFRLKVQRTELAVLITGILCAAGLVFYVVLNDQPFDEANSAFGRLIGNNTAVEKSNEARIGVLSSALDEFENAPFFGKGFLVRARYSHNTYVNLLEAGGLVSITGMLMWWMGMSRCWWQMRRRALLEARRHEFILLLTLISTVLVVIVNSTFEPFLTDRNGYIPFGIILSLWYSMKLNIEQVNAAKSHP